MSSNVGFCGHRGRQLADPALEVVVLELGRREIGGAEERDRRLTEHQRADAVDVGVGEARLHDTPLFFTVERRPLLAGDLSDALPRERAAVAVLHDRGEAVVPHREHERGAGEDLGVLVEESPGGRCGRGPRPRSRATAPRRAMRRGRPRCRHSRVVAPSCPRPRRPRSPSRWRRRGRGTRLRAQSHRSARPGPSRPQTTRHSSRSRRRRGSGWPRHRRSRAGRRPMPPDAAPSPEGYSLVVTAPRQRRCGFGTRIGRW